MALTVSSDVVANRALITPAIPFAAGVVMVQRFKASVAATLSINNLVGLAVLPAYCLPVGLDMYLDDIDDATALVWEAGILDTATTALVTGSKLISAATVGRAAGVQSVNIHNGIHEPATWLAEALSPGIAEEKIVAMFITTAAGTPAAGDIYGTFYYASADNAYRIG